MDYFLHLSDEQLDPNFKTQYRLQSLLPRKFFNVYSLILGESERARTHTHMRASGEGAERERGREDPKQAPHSVQSPTGSTPQAQDRDLSQNQELDAQRTEPPRRPDEGNF